MSLTVHQKEAVGHLSGNLQLIACAGSGKTEVVAQQITNLLSPLKEGGGGLRPSNIIAFTFTEKAAAELKERIGDRCRSRHPDLTGMAEMFVGTIHGFCLELLRSEVPEFLKYDVLNEIQQVLFIDRNSAKSGLTNTTTLQGQKLKRYVDTRLYISALNILRESEINHTALNGNAMAVGLASYRSLLREKGYLDYSAIVEQAVLALETDEALRGRIAGRVKVVIVDEYQDRQSDPRAASARSSRFGSRRQDRW
jgi:DNA helicase-2/ATP-dependent DNA helicase PcrA